MSEEPENEIEKLQAENKDLKDKYLRSLAESENARKRLQKERLEAIQYATEGLVADFLHPIDNLENALKIAGDMSPDVKNWAMGFQMILNQLKEVLSQHGVVSDVTVGQEFDPHHHEAIEIVETTEYPDGRIIQEFSRGYRIGTRTVRPAKVKVAKTPSEDIEVNDKEQKDE